MPPPQPTSGMKNPITSGPLSPWCSVCEMHDPTGEPSAGNPHAGFGVQPLRQRTGFEPDRGDPVRQLAHERNQRFGRAGDP